ncbi:MAG: hypothetical protein ACFCUQ_05300, partial [Kiloniellales bacterium]
KAHRPIARTRANPPAKPQPVGATMVMKLNRTAVAFADHDGAGGDSLSKNLQHSAVAADGRAPELH